uniref:Uncharacterized protein n=1 Tax=Polytomella parva TaxID=51329 RepID=A0A7S0UQZ0_9CHLO|mmetsp:Transcript_13357/g.23648  ORF Transcript_13357/g.23648 Transcript_13357/m.23648 type:complete len:352 (+) Transcript_13357:36-1091(+)
MAEKRNKIHISKNDVQQAVIIVGITYSATSLIRKVVSSLFFLAKNSLNGKDKKDESICSSPKLASQANKSSPAPRKLKRDPCDSLFPPPNVPSLDINKKESFSIKKPVKDGILGEDNVEKSLTLESLKAEINVLRKDFQATQESGISLRDFLRENLSTSNKIKELEAENKKMKITVERMDGELQALKAASLVDNGHELEMFKFHLQQQQMQASQSDSLKRSRSMTGNDYYLSNQGSHSVSCNRSMASVDGRSDASENHNVPIYRNKSMLSQLYSLFRGSSPIPSSDCTADRSNTIYSMPSGRSFLDPNSSSLDSLAYRNQLHQHQSIANTSQKRGYMGPPATVLGSSSRNA